MTRPAGKAADGRAGGTGTGALRPRFAAVRRFLPLGLILILLAAALASGLWRDVSLSNLQAHHAALRGFVAGHRAASLALYAAALALIVTACLPGMSVLLVAGGYLFGIALGGAVGLAAATAGSAPVFLANRAAFGGWLTRRSGPRMARLAEAVRQDGFLCLLTLRLIPAAPFFAVPVAAAVAGARLRDLLAATVIGSAPTAFLLAYLGAGLGNVFSGAAPLDHHLLEQPRILLPLAGLAALSVLPWLWRAMRRRSALATRP
jgi:uncharacterized membrane protein YdjX (TVP38/TMEM64 family)